MQYAVMNYVRGSEGERLNSRFGNLITLYREDGGRTYLWNGIRWIEITDEGRYFPVSATTLIDSAGGSWGGGFTTAADTTYTFRPEDNLNIWPAGCHAVSILIAGLWDEAQPHEHSLSAKKNGGVLNELQIRDYSINKLILGQGIVQVDASGYFTLHAANHGVQNAVCRLLGYFL